MLLCHVIKLSIACHALLTSMQRIILCLSFRSYYVREVQGLFSCPKNGAFYRTMLDLMNSQCAHSIICTYSDITHICAAPITD